MKLKHVYIGWFRTEIMWVLSLKFSVHQEKLQKYRDLYSTTLVSTLLAIKLYGNYFSTFELDNKQFIFWLKLTFLF